LKKKVETLDALTQVFVTYLIEARFVTSDAFLRRLHSKLGEEHRKSYDSYAKTFFRDMEILKFQVEQYFDHGSEYVERLQTLGMDQLDRAITDLAEAGSSNESDNLTRDPRWEYVDKLLNQVVDSLKETLQSLAFQLKPEYISGNEPMPWKHYVNQTLFENAIHVPATR
jgi:hypothetical protein